MVLAAISPHARIELCNSADDDEDLVATAKTQPRIMQGSEQSQHQASPRSLVADKSTSC